MYAFICLISLGIWGCETTNNNYNISISSSGHIIQNTAIRHCFSYYYYIGESIVVLCQVSPGRPSIGKCAGNLTSYKNWMKCEIKGFEKLCNTSMTCGKRYDETNALKVYFFQRNDPGLTVNCFEIPSDKANNMNFFREFLFSLADSEMIHCFLIICLIECMYVEASIADLEISLSGFPNESDGRYSFSDSETLNLICAIKRDDNGPAYGLLWFFDGELHVGKQNSNNTHVINIISFNITESDDGKKIKCIAKEKRAINDHSVPTSEESVDSKLEREVELIFYEPQELLPAASTFDTTNLWIYAAIASAILALISIVSCMASILTSRKKKKKKKKMTQKSNEENEINFSQFHRRIEQSNQSTECLYSEPTDSRNSNYATSKSIIYPTNDVYTVPYKPKDVSEMYAKPIPKAYRKKEAGLHYAEIEPKENSKIKPGGSYYNKVEENELKTSENTDNINEYDYVKAKNAYYNVFNGESYVNAKSNRKNEVYTEPAYCEIPIEIPK